MVNGIRQSLGLDLVYINVYTIFIKILRMKLEFGPGSFFLEFWPLQSLHQLQLTFLNTLG